MVYHSPLTNGFLFYRNVDGKTVYSDAKGKEFTRETFEKMLPLQNYSQLTATNQMPDSINGVALDMYEVRKNNIYIRIRPSYIDQPQIKLYPMLESKSGRVRLEMPDVYFRITDRMEFINSSTNTLNPGLTETFTAALQKNDFAFPATVIGGNPTTRKPFDEGYFVVDSNNKLFHIKMVKGQPYCAQVEIPADLNIRYIDIREMNLKEFYGFIFSNDDRVFLIHYPDYKLVQMPISNYNHKSDIYFLTGTLFDRCISIISDTGLKAFAMDRNYKVVDTYEETWQDRHQQTAGVVASYLFPYTIELTSANSYYIDFYTRYSGLHTVLGIAFFLLLTIVVFRIRKRDFKKSWPDFIIVALSGIYGFIAVNLFENIKKKI